MDVVSWLNSISHKKEMAGRSVTRLSGGVSTKDWITRHRSWLFNRLPRDLFGGSFQRKWIPLSKAGVPRCLRQENLIQDSERGRKWERERKRAWGRQNNSYLMAAIQLRRTRKASPDNKAPFWTLSLIVTYSLFQQTFWDISEPPKEVDTYVSLPSFLDMCNIDLTVFLD